MHGVLDDEKLIAYLDGELPDDERVEFEKSLEEDESAQKALAALRERKEATAIAEAELGGVISGFSCENCQAHYTIEFEKVAGKVFRVSCKKCGESITIKGDAETLSEVPAPRTSAIAERLSLSAMTMAPFEPEESTDADPSGAVSDSPAALSDGSLFSSDALDVPRTQSTMEADQQSSVLFSRSGLEHLAASPPEEQGETDASTSYIDEPSGLMDIRALGSPIYTRQDTAADEDEDDILTLGAAPTSFNPPVLTVKPTQKMNAWMKITLAACAVAVLVVTAVLWITAAPDEDDLATSQQIAALQKEIARLQKDRGQSERPPVVAKPAKKARRPRGKKSGPAADTAAVKQPAQKISQQQSPGQSGATASTGAAGSAISPQVGTNKPAVATKEPPGGVVAAKPSGNQGQPSAEPGGTPSAEKQAAAPVEENASDIPDSPYATNTPKPEGQTAVPADQQATKEINNLLASKEAADPSPAEAVAAAQKTAPSSPSPSGVLSGAKAKLDRADVQKGMRAVAAKVKACAQGQTGRVTVKVVIGQTGRVASAVAVDTFAGTPTGVCAAKAVRQAKFPISKTTLTVKYPFNLQ